MPSADSPLLLVRKQINDIEVGYPEMDIQIAELAVRHAVASGTRSNPSDLFMLPHHVINQWFRDEAIRFLDEGAKRKQAGV